MFPQPAFPNRTPRSCRSIRIFLAALVVLGGVGFSLAQTRESEETVLRDEGSSPEVVGLMVRVADLDRALKFYNELLAFEVVGRDHYPALVELKNGPVELILLQVGKPTKIDYPHVTEAHLNIQIEELGRTLEELRQREVPFLEKEPAQAAIGPYMPITDPSGNLLLVIELSFHEGPLPRPRVFNFEITVTDMGKAREFYCGKLGFKIFSEDYYPPVIPLQRSGTMPLVLQDTATVNNQPPAPDTAQMNLLIAVDDLPAAIRDLQGRGVEFLDPDAQTFPLGAHAAFRDPFGNVHLLFERR